MKTKILFVLILLITIITLPQNISKHKGFALNNIKYLALGDSYTIGESVLEKDRWPLQLRDSLIQHGFQFEKVDIVAKTGWTTDELDEGISGNVTENDYNLVSLLIGVNNQYRGRDIAEFRMHFKDLLMRSIKFCNGNKKKLFVLSIPDWGVTPFAKERDSKKIAREIDNYNSVKKMICKKLGIEYFDITEISREAANDRTLLAEDGLHPSGKMYAKWVSLILPEVMQKLEK